MKWIQEGFRYHPLISLFHPALALTGSSPELCSSQESRQDIQNASFPLCPSILVSGLYNKGKQAILFSDSNAIQA